jgi:topoisomerase (DNA) II binding protein 1
LAAGDPVEDGYRLPAFKGLCLCVTGYTQDERAQLEAQVVAAGGRGLLWSTFLLNLFWD